MIKLKQYTTPVQPTVSVESELQQLEAVVVALEAAQENPEVAALLFGPSIGLESEFGTKVKETAKKLWEALIAFIKKLTGWGKKTEEKAEEVTNTIKENTQTWSSPVKEVTEMELEMDDFEQGVKNYNTFSSIPQPAPEKWLSKFTTFDGKVAWHLFQHYVKTHSSLFNKKNVVTFSADFVKLASAVENDDDAKVKIYLLRLYDDAFSNVPFAEHVNRGDLYNDPWKHIKHLVSLEMRYPNKVEAFNFKKHVFGLQPNLVIPWINKLTQDLNEVNESLLRCTEKFSAMGDDAIDPSTIRNLSVLKDLARHYEKHVSDEIEFYRAVDKAMEWFKK